MKLVESKIIAKAEGIFCNTMSSMMDLATIGSLFREKYNLRLCAEAEFQDLDLVVFNNQIALRFDYMAAAYFSIYMDREGNFLGMEETANPTDGQSDNSNGGNPLVDPREIRKRISQLADAIAATIEKETFAKLIEVKSHTKLIGRHDFMGARFAVYQNRPVYNLIYQGQIALSFLMDEKGRFLDFAEPKGICADDKDESESSNPKVLMDKDDHIEQDAPQLVDSEVPELIESEDIITVVEEMIDGIEGIFFDESDGSEQNRAVR